MEITVKRKDFLNTTRWSGGTTKELVIYPSHSKYSNRDFLFRISTATIETERSDFTMLPGVHRTLMLLKGKLKIVHPHEEKILKPFDAHQFEGGWKTESYGEATDFNVMTTGDCRGEVRALTINSEKIELTINPKEAFGFLVWEGSVKFINKDESVVLVPGDFIFLKEETAANKFEFESSNNATMIWASLKNL